MCCCTSVLQISDAAAARLFKLEKSQTTRQGKSRTDAYLTNLRTGTGKKGLATSTHWIGRKLHQLLRCFIPAHDLQHLIDSMFVAGVEHFNTGIVTAFAQAVL